MKNSSYDVALFGPVFLDHIMMGFSGWPQPGRESFATGYHLEPGGGCFNTACGLAKLGCSAICFAVVGEADGDWLIERVRQFGVSTGEIRRSQKPTGVSVSVSMPEDRSFFTYRGANADLVQWLEESSLVDYLAQARHVHFALPLPSKPGLRIIDELHARGCTVSLDVGWEPTWLHERNNLEVLRQVDLFLPNKAEADAITGQTALREVMACFERIGARAVALKLGPDGAALLANGEYVEAHPIPVIEVDTTGAGDAFNAGFLHAFLESQPLAACLHRGVICGSLSVRKPGSITSFPSIEEVFEQHEKCYQT